MKTFESYLLNKNQAFNTIRASENTVKEFENWTKSEGMKVANCTSNDLMNYVAFCQSKNNKVITIRLKIKSLAHYYDYLMSEGKTTHNPAQLLKLKGGTQKIPHKLLDQEELKTIYEHQETYGLTQKRNKILLSLVVFQAVGSTELVKIELKDVDLVNGKIYIPGTRTSNSRTLELKVQQLLLFQDYITNTRPEILKEANKTSEYLLVNQGKGKGILSNVISVLIRNLHRQYPKLTSLQQVRQSVVTQWIKEHGLRKAQYMAGHRYVSSTERYNEDRLEGLKKELKMHYVMK
jgi:site-specific recombinase XerD